jgi:hypothetical protein
MENFVLYLAGLLLEIKLIEKNLKLNIISIPLDAGAVKQFLSLIKEKTNIAQIVVHLKLQIKLHEKEDLLL